MVAVKTHLLYSTGAMHPQKTNTAFCGFPRQVENNRKPSDRVDDWVDDMRQGSRVTELLREARDGNVEALGDALTAFRSRLTRFAVKYLGTRKVSPVTSPSELVQNMELIATRHFPDFRGSTTAEWWRWLRRILLRIMIRAARPTGLDRRWVPIES